MERKAKQLYENQLPTEVAQVLECRIICAYAYAVSEQNADNGIIVTAPTCGAAGVLPSVLRYVQETRGCTEEQVLRAGHCRHSGEPGQKKRLHLRRRMRLPGRGGRGLAPWAAGGLAELYGLNLDQVEYAAEIALEHHLGLTCDPICGLVQVPCIERNAVAAMRAMNACNLSYCLCGTRNISYDMVCKAMYETGPQPLPSVQRDLRRRPGRFYNRRRTSR